MQEQNVIINLILELFLAKCRPVFREIIFEAIAPMRQPMDPPEEEELMSASEAKTFLKCSKATLSNWTRDGKIKSFKIGGKLYYKKETLLKNLKERKF